MTRRKREIIGLRSERYVPHRVELALPLGPFRSGFLEIDAFHRERRIPVRRGRNRYEVKQVYISILLPRHCQGYPTPIGPDHHRPTPPAGRSADIGNQDEWP